MRLQTLKYAVLSFSLAAASTAFASTATLANLNTQTVGGVGFTITSATNNDFGCNCFSVSEPGTYTSATVSNMPAPGDPIVQLGASGVTTINFASPVDNLLLYVFSLGGSGTTSTYTFDHAVTVLSSGTNGLYPEYNGGHFTTTADSITGDEANGTIEFAGPISTLTITDTNGEYYSGFELGVLGASTSATPEPESLVMVGTGLIGLAGLVRRRLSR
jgi:hypothetical protein